ncbi:MAG: type III pantothenate kinase [Turicibacter sp.]|nr:type III pantothenate kinase [Turicibacter sp.]
MILAVNIGNTNIRAAIGQIDIEAQAVFYSDEIADFSTIATLFANTLDFSWDEIEGVIISTVVPEKTELIIAALSTKTDNIKRVDVSKRLNTEAYSGLLGEDRAVCSFMALQKYIPPFVIIDFGTATTINIVNGASEFIGGAILSGLFTGLNALNTTTAQLPKIDFEQMQNIPIIGKNTAENLASGAVYGLAAAAEGFLNRIEKEMPLTAVIVTGGHAPIILPYATFDYVHEPDLLLLGLFALYRQEEKA